MDFRRSSLWMTRATISLPTSDDGHVLPDLLTPGLVTVFCGSAVGTASARLGAPYAGPGNRFWPMLAETGLTPERFAPAIYRALLDVGIGLTDLNKTQLGADSDLTPEGDDARSLLAKIEAHQPCQLAFTAKRPAQAFLDRVFGLRRIEYGPQDRAVGDTSIFVLPSPSGLAVRWWDPEWWFCVAERHRSFKEDE